MEMTFHIVAMRTSAGSLPHNAETVATFDVDVWPFKIWKGMIRRRPDGTLLATLPGRKVGGVSISSPQLRDAICDAAIEHYKDNFNG